MTAPDASTFDSWNDSLIDSWNDSLIDSWVGSWVGEWGCEIGRRTWVDPDGSPWAFAGAVVDGDTTFAIPEPVDADQPVGRMVFTDAAGDSSRRRWGKPSVGGTGTVDREIDGSRRAGRTTG